MHGTSQVPARLLTGFRTPLTPCRMPKGRLEPFMMRHAIRASSAMLRKLFTRVGRALLPAYTLAAMCRSRNRICPAAAQESEPAA